jgi:transposase
VKVFSVLNIWLIEGLRPSYKSIADFRKNNSTALKATNRDFILLCKELALLGGSDVAVDGSFFKADASKAGIYTEPPTQQTTGGVRAKNQRLPTSLDRPRCRR